MNFSQLIYLLIFLPGVIFAQDNYHAGYVINLNGDTTRGSINYREWSINPDLVEFKPELAGSSVIQLIPKSILEFGINNMENYRSYTGLVSADKLQNINTTYGHDTKSVQDTLRINRSVFLKLQTTGKYLSLYKYADKDKIRFFFTEGLKLPVELQYHEYYDEDTRQIKTVDLFKSQLIELASRYSSDEKVIAQIQTLNYGSTDLGDLIDKLNGVSAAYKKSNQHESTGFFFGLSADATSTYYSKQLRSDLTNNVTNTTNLPGLSAGFDVYLNPNVQRFIFRSDIAVSYNHPSFSYTYADNLFTVYQHYTFNQITVSVSPKLIYNLYNTDKLKVFLGGAMSFNYSYYWNNKLSTTNVTTNYSGSTEKTDPFSLRPFWVSFPILAGIRLKQKFEISVTFAPTSLYAENNAFAVGNSMISLGLKYHFKRN